MGLDDDELQPEQVDEQIEALAQSALEGNQSAQFVQRLQHYYDMEKQKNALEHAWQQISQRYDSSMLASSIDEESVQNKPKKLERPGQYRMQQRVPDKKTVQGSFPRWGVMLAVAVLALVIGSTAVIMSRAAQQNGSPGLGGSHSGGPSSACIPTPTPTMLPPTTTLTPTPKPTQQPGPTPTVLPSSDSSAAGTAAVVVIPPTAAPKPVDCSTPLLPTMQPTPTQQPGLPPTATPKPIQQPGPTPTAIPNPTQQPPPTPTRIPNPTQQSTPAPTANPKPTQQPGSPPTTTP